MTSPFNYKDQVGSMNKEIDSAVAGSEWSSFLAKRKELLDVMMQTAMPHAPEIAPPGADGQPSVSMVPVQPGSQMQKGTPEQIGQAHFWGIQNPEQLDSAELQHQIDQRRAEVPHDQQTSLSSALFAGGAAAAAAAGGAAQLIGHAFQNIGGAAENIPFIGPTLNSILNNDQSKLFLQNLQSKSAEAVEAASAMQPESDKTAFQFLTGAGKMAGYALPAIAAWEGLGAAAGIPRLAWLGRAGTPLVRAAARGALTSAILEDPDAPIESKVMNLGLGAVMGGASMWGAAGAAVAGGTIGAGIGSQVGDTPEDRQRHMIEFGVGGAALGFLAPTLAQSFSKVKTAFSDGTIPVDPVNAPPGEVDADWHFIDESTPQISGNPIPTRFRALGAPGQPTPTDAEGLSALLHSEPPMELGVNGELVQAEPLHTNGLPAPQTRALLPAVTGDNPNLPYPADLTSSERDLSTFEFQRNAPPESKGLSEVTQGPAHLIGSKVADINGYPLRVYHGTAADFSEFDPMALDGDALFGPALYHTEDPSIASGHAARTDDLVAMQFAPEGPLYPNIRPALLDIKNPFNADQNFTQPESHAIVDRLEQLLPEFNWNRARDTISDPASSFSTSTRTPSTTLTGEELYNTLASVNPVESVPGPVRQIAGLEFPVRMNLGKSGLNNALQSIGYDGITHIGGARTGNAPHRVWIALAPAQVHPYFAPRNLDITDARSAAEAISKQATVMESGTLPQTVGKVEVTESDVIDAAKNTMPGGTAVVRGVGKALDVLREHPDVKFVEREGKLDALVGEFTNDMIDDYQRWGTYEGNIVVTASGIEGEISSISGKGMATLKRMAGGPPLRVKVENVLPSRYGDPVYTGADLWPSFKADLLRYMNEESSKAGMAPVNSLWDPRVPSQIQGHLEDYLNRRGINDLGLRHAIDLAINESFVNEARDLDPEAKELQARLGDQATIEANDRETGDEPLPVSLEERAESRGFVWLSKPSADGGILRDLINPEGAFETSMQTDAAAEEFLHSVDRTAPDLAPASDVPFDVMESVPTGTSFEPATGTEETIDTLAEDVRASGYELDRLEASGGGSNQPPAPPAGGGFNFSNPPELPPGRQETVGSQFQKLHRTQPEKWAELERKWAGNHFRYSRYMFASLENDIVRAGVDKGLIWRHITDLETARAKADNEAYDWLKEGGEILRQFPKPLLRSGFVTRTHEITSDPERFRRWWGLQQEGYSDGQIRKMIDGDEKLRDIYHRLFISGVESPDIGFRPEQEILRYISHVRSRQAQGPLSSDPYDPRGLLSPSMQFFAEFARKGNVQFRVMDTRTLFNYYVRSMMFKKYQAAPYERLVSAWQDNRIPSNISKLAIDHAEAMRFGYRPEPTIAVKAVQGVIEGMLGVPITTSEASRIASGPLGWMYRSLLGGKTSIFFRDATQHLVALTKVRAGFMAGVYRDILGYWRGGEGKQQLLEDYQLALKHGWVTRDRPAMEVATPFENETGSDTQLLGLTPKQAAARERVARIGDVLLPHWLTRFDDMVNTLRLYGREQQLNQFISGMSAYRQAKAGLAEYRQLETRAALEGNPSLAMDYNTFARKSFFSSFQPAIKNRLQELVNAGDDEEAAAMFAREVTKWSQHVYTVREKPAALRGGFGRMASFLGNFTGQFLEGANAAMRYGEPEHIARALMVIGGFSYAMKKIGDQLGMRNLASWAWSASLHYAGSPLLEMGSQAVLGYGGAMAAAEDRSMSPLQAEALKDIPGGLETATQFFPYTGYLRTAGALSEAAQGTTPAADISRFLLSGDKGSGINFLLQQRARAADFTSRYDPVTGTLRPTPTGSLSPNGGTMQQAVPHGLVTPGNIDLNHRPIVRNPDGSISTVRSFSVGIDGREVLLPQVSDQGTIISQDSAIQNYRRTGKHLGIFATPADANAYAQQLHQDQARQYLGHPGSGGRQ